VTAGYCDITSPYVYMLHEIIFLVVLVTCGDTCLFRSSLWQLLNVSCCPAQSTPQCRRNYRPQRKSFRQLRTKQTMAASYALLITTLNNNHTLQATTAPVALNICIIRRFKMSTFVIPTYTTPGHSASGSNLRQVVHTRASVTKPYKLVTVNRQ